MLLWYAGLSFALVMIVFDSPLLDYRLVMLGSVLPTLDRLWAPPWPMHSVFFPVLVMTLVMTLASGRRLVQRRWIGLSIGLFMHLVLGAAFARGDVFWWPVRGWGSGASPPMPSLGVTVALEVIGAVVLVWLARRFLLMTPPHRRRFVRTGHIDRGLLQA